MNAAREEDTLDEMWRIKREIGAETRNWEEYAAALFAFQEEERKRGVKFVRLPPRAGEPYPAVSVPPLSVAEEDAGYDKSKESAPPPSPYPLFASSFRGSWKRNRRRACGHGARRAPGATGTGRRGTPGRAGARRGRRRTPPRRRGRRRG